MTNVAFDSIDDYRDIETLNLYKEAQEKGEDMDAFLKAIQEKGRDNVRTPMQWDNTPNAGFTEGQPWININPNYREINVRKAIIDPHSVFHFYKKILAFRKKHPTFVYGKYKDIAPMHESIYAYRRWDENETFVILLNFSSETQHFRLPEFYGNIELEISNYGGMDFGELEEVTLLPWEGRIYQKR